MGVGSCAVLVSVCEGSVCEGLVRFVLTAAKVPLPWVLGVLGAMGVVVCSPVHLVCCAGCAGVAGQWVVATAVGVVVALALLTQSWYSFQRRRW